MQLKRAVLLSTMIGLKTTEHAYCGITSKLYPTSVTCYDFPELKRKSHLRNEFHFSDVHGAMNGSGSRAK